MNYEEISQILGDEKDILLNHRSETFQGIEFNAPSMDSYMNVFANSDRSEKVQSNLRRVFSTGRLKDTGYLSILPIDQGVEHGAGASFARNPIYFDPECIAKLALEAGCNGVATTLGNLGLISKKYADKIPFIVKLNHNELLTYPNKFDQIMFSQVQQAVDMGASGVGATIYFGSENSSRQIVEVSQAFAEAHRHGLFTILWCYLRNPEFKKSEEDLHSATDITGQANHLGVTIEADIIKQKMPTTNGGFKKLKTEGSDYGKFDEAMYSGLTSENPIDMVKFQVANCYLGKIPMLNSGGASGENDLLEAVKLAVINKRGGGAGIILGRKAFQKSFEDGIKILNSVQDVYLTQEITPA